MPWTELERRLSDRSPVDRTAGADERPGDGSDAPAWSRRRGEYRPPPDLAGGDQQTFVAEAVIAKRTRRARNGRNVTEYLVRWSGYSADDDTWEPARHLKPPLAEASTWNLVEAYEAAH